MVLDFGICNPWLHLYHKKSLGILQHHKHGVFLDNDLEVWNLTTSFGCGADFICCKVNHTAGLCVVAYLQFVAQFPLQIVVLQPILMSFIESEKISLSHIMWIQVCLLHSFSGPSSIVECRSCHSCGINCDRHPSTLVTGPSS